MIKKIAMSLIAASVVFTTNVSACPSSYAKKSTCFHKKSTSASTAAKVINAVSKTGLSAAQTKKIAEGIEEYKATTKKIKKMKIFPIDSFVGNTFDEKRFVSEMSEKYIASVAAKAALYKYVFSVLDDEQRKVFKREYAAPLIEKIIKSY